MQWMMIAVAIVALLTTAVSPELTRRWRACQVAARRHEQLAQMHSTFAGIYPKPSALAAVSRQKAALHRELSRRNRWAFIDPFHACVLDRDIY